MAPYKESLSRLLVGTELTGAPYYLLTYLSLGGCWREDSVGAPAAAAHAAAPSGDGSCLAVAGSCCSIFAPTPPLIIDPPTYLHRCSALATHAARCFVIFAGSDSSLSPPPSHLPAPQRCSIGWPCTRAASGCRCSLLGRRQVRLKLGAWQKVCMHASESVLGGLGWCSDCSHSKIAPAC